MAAALPRIEVGGQAVIEGVMMRSPRSFAVVCRRPGGEIVIKEDAWQPVWGGVKALRLPFLRGAIVLVESLWNGLSALSFAADQQMIETAVAPTADAPRVTPAVAPTQALATRAALDAARDQKPARPLSLGARAAEQPEELSQTAKLGMLAVSVLFGLVLFVGTPHLTAWGIGALVGYSASSVWFHLVDGLVKTGLLVGYLAAISLLPDIRRVFQYHGAEHKAIATYEAFRPLTLDEARRQSRFHPRCGTSFLLIVVLVSVALFATVLRGQLADTPAVDHLLKILFKVPLMIPIAGLAYEAIKLSGRYYDRSRIARALALPGLWLQKVTTREPTDDQLEIALLSIRKTLWRERLGDRAAVAPGGVQVYASAAEIDLPLL